MEVESGATDQHTEIEQLKSAFPGKVKVISNIGEFTNVVSVQPTDLDFHVKFQLTAAYPEISPVISIRSILSPDQKEALTSYLMSKLSEEQCPSLTELCSSCGCWLQDNGVEAKEPITKQAGAKHGGKKKGKKNKNKTKAEETPQADKKPPMKTAHDVIKRLNWDEAVDKECFIVGYMDRIVGLVERAFVEFTWEDLASVDHFALAIPQHRIQYFKYKTEKVWDKNERLDNVFGSTGSGTTIVEAVEKYEAKLKQLEEAAETDNKGADTADDVGQGSEVKDGEHEERDNENNERTSCKSVEHDRNMIENDSRHTENEKMRDNIEITKGEAKKDKGQKLEDDEVEKNAMIEAMKEDSATSIRQTGMNLDPEPTPSVASLDSAPATGRLDRAPTTDTESPEDPRFAFKKGRNYFVALRITNQEILDKVAKVQNELETRYPQYGPHRNSAHTMHVTLNAMTLTSVHDLQRCVLAMNKIKQNLVDLAAWARPVAFKGVGCFSSKVVFARVDCPPELYDIANLIVKTFKEEGVSVESKGLGRNPHLTLFKVGRSDEWNDFDLNLRHYKGVNFGRQIIDKIHVCQMVKLSEDQGGFYVTIYTLHCDPKQSSR